MGTFCKIMKDMGTICKIMKEIKKIYFHPKLLQNSSSFLFSPLQPTSQRSIVFTIYTTQLLFSPSN